MANAAGCLCTQLIDGESNLKVDRLKKFMNALNLRNESPYVIVSIMGPQSSGKSTLLNHLFATDFKAMDAKKGRTQTTQGIWMARCSGVVPTTIVLDIEGNDSAERKNDTTFANRSAVFALAVSDVVLVNMWYTDIGREEAANKPLLRTIVQAMMTLITSPRKTTLMFVIRDYDITEEPFEILKKQVEEGFQEIWDETLKSQVYKEKALSDCFNVRVVGLPPFKFQKEQFNTKVAELREEFNNSNAPGRLAGDREGTVPASAFSISAQNFWKSIKEDKELDLPAHKVLVATVRCEELAKDCYDDFEKHQGWTELERDSKSHFVEGFGLKLSPIISICLSEYDSKALHFDESIVAAKKKNLKEKVLQLALQVFNLNLEHLRIETLDKFKKTFSEALKGNEEFVAVANRCKQSCIDDFDAKCKDAVIKEANWDTSKEMSKFICDLDGYIKETKTKMDMEKWKAIVRSDEILKECYKNFVNSMEWTRLKRDSQSHFVDKIGQKLSAIIDNCVSEYDSKTSCFEESITAPKKRDLKEKVLQLALQVFNLNLEHLRIETLDKFKKTFSEALKGNEEFVAVANRCKQSCIDDFDAKCKDAVIKEANWDTSKEMSKFICDLDGYIKETKTKMDMEKLKAIVRSDEIVKECYGNLVNSMEWTRLKRDSESHFVDKFRQKLSATIDNCVSEYDSKTSCFEESITAPKKRDLKDRVFELARQAMDSHFRYLRLKEFSKFKKEFHKEFDDAFDIPALAASIECRQRSIKCFDELCEDAVITQVNYDTSIARLKFIGSVDDYIKSEQKSKTLENILAVPTIAALFFFGLTFGQPMGAVRDFMPPIRKGIRKLLFGKDANQIEGSDREALVSILCLEDASQVGKPQALRALQCFLRLEDASQIGEPRMEALQSLLRLEDPSQMGEPHREALRSLFKLGGTLPSLLRHEDASQIRESLEEFLGESLGELLGESPEEPLGEFVIGESSIVSIEEI